MGTHRSQALSRRSFAPRFTPALLALLIAGHLGLLAVRYMVTDSFVAGDSAWQFATMRSLYMQRSLDVREEAAFFYENRSPHTGNRRLPGVPAPDPVTGLVTTVYPVGAVLVRLPAYALADVLSHGARLAGFQVDTAGYTGLYQAIPAAFSMLWAAAGLMALARTRSDGGGTRNGRLLATVTVWLATPIVYYLTIEPLMSHSISVGLACGLGALALRTYYDDRRRGYLWMGVLCGLLAITRYQDATFFLVPFVLCLRSRRVLESIALATVGALPFLFIQLAVNATWYGSPWTTGYASVADPRWLSPELWRHLFNPVQGVFTTHPIQLLSLAGFLLLRGRDRAIGGPLLIIFAVQVYVISMAIPTTPGMSFGNRTITSLAPLFVLCWDSVTSRWPRLHAAGVVLTVVNLALMSLYSLRIVRNPWEA